MKCISPRNNIFFSIFFFFYIHIEYLIPCVGTELREIQSPRNNIRSTSVIMNGEPLEEFSSFKLLRSGANMWKDGRLNSEIGTKIATATEIMDRLERIWTISASIQSLKSTNRWSYPSSSTGVIQTHLVEVGKRIKVFKNQIL